MRRFWATLLLAVSALSLVAPALFAIEAQSTLAACCRRGGRHRCVMQDEAAPGGGVRMLSSRCALFPGARALPVTGQASAALNGPAVVVATASSYAVLRPQSANFPRISYDSAAQKRGPPSLS